MSQNRVLVGATVVAWMIQLVWLISPIDPIPDLIPFLGWLDDLVSLALTMALTAGTLDELQRTGARLTAKDPGYEPISAHEWRAS